MEKKFNLQRPPKRGYAQGGVVMRPPKRGYVHGGTVHREEEEPLGVRAARALRSGVVTGMEALAPVNEAVGMPARVAAGLISAPGQAIRKFGSDFAGEYFGDGAPSVTTPPATKPIIRPAAAATTPTTTTAAAPAGAAPPKERQPIAVRVSDKRAAPGTQQQAVAAAAPATAEPAAIARPPTGYQNRSAEAMLEGSGLSVEDALKGGHMVSSRNDYLPGHFNQEANRIGFTRAEIAALMADQQKAALTGTTSTLSMNDLRPTSQREVPLLHGDATAGFNAKTGERYGDHGDDNVEIIKGMHRSTVDATGRPVMPAIPPGTPPELIPFLNMAHRGINVPTAIVARSLAEQGANARNTATLAQPTEAVRTLEGISKNPALRQLDQQRRAPQEGGMSAIVSGELRRALAATTTPAERMEVLNKFTGKGDGRFLVANRKSIDSNGNAVSEPYLFDVHAKKWVDEAPGATAQTAQSAPKRGQQKRDANGVVITYDGKKWMDAAGNEVKPKGYAEGGIVEPPNSFEFLNRMKAKMAPSEVAKLKAIDIEEAHAISRPPTKPAATTVARRAGYALGGLVEEEPPDVGGFSESAGVYGGMGPANTPQLVQGPGTLLAPPPPPSRYDRVKEAADAAGRRAFFSMKAFAPAKAEAKVWQKAGYAEGGKITRPPRLVKGPGTGTSDSITAVVDGKEEVGLSTGEFVIPAAAVKKIGAENLQKMIDEAMG